MDAKRLLMAAAMLVVVAFGAASQPVHAAGTTYTVNTTADNTTGGDGLCTLREAMLAANNAPANADCGVGSVGLDTIAFNIPGAGVRTITPVSALPIITDPVFIDGTTQPLCILPCIELNGTAAGNSNGLWIMSGGSTVKGLVINRFSVRGISLETNSGNTITGNYIGTDATGTQERGNGGDGIHICCGSSNNTIGGSSPSARNLISGNAHFGVQIEGDTSGNWILGNYIGTSVDGKHPLSNHYDGAIIARVVAGPAPTNNTIGRKPDGSGSANKIGFNDGNGITIGFNSADPTLGNAILGNSIFSNGCLAIDLSDTTVGCAGGWSVTPNDNGDGDSGPNGRQNYPELKSASHASKTVKAKLNSTPNKTFRVEFFLTKKCDGSKYGEGKKYLGFMNVMTASTGIAKFAFHSSAGLATGQSITATATDSSNNTSEFSKCTVVVPS